MYLCWAPRQRPHAPAAVARASGPTLVSSRGTAVHPPRPPRSTAPVAFPQHDRRRPLKLWSFDSTIASLWNRSPQSGLRDDGPAVRPSVLPRRVFVPRGNSSPDPVSNTSNSTRARFQLGIRRLSMAWPPSRHHPAHRAWHKEVTPPFTAGPDCLDLGPRQGRAARQPPRGHPLSSFPIHFSPPYSLPALVAGTSSFVPPSPLGRRPPPPPTVAHHVSTSPP